MSGKVGFIMGRTKKEMDLLAASAAKKKRKGKIEFLYILPFILLVAVFSYYPLWGWVYAFFDYKPPFPLEWKNFVGLKWCYQKYLRYERYQLIVLMVPDDLRSVS